MAEQLIPIEEAMKLLKMDRKEVLDLAKRNNWRLFRSEDTLKLRRSDIESAMGKPGGEIPELEEVLEEDTDETVEARAVGREEPESLVREGARAGAKAPAEEEGLDLSELEEETDETVEAKPKVAKDETEEIIFEDTGETFDISLLEEEEGKEGAGPAKEDVALREETDETVVPAATPVEEEGGREEGVASIYEAAPPKALEAEEAAEWEEAAVEEEPLEEVELAGRELPSARAARERVAARAEEVASPILSAIIAISVLALLYAGVFIVNTVGGWNNALTGWTRALSGGM